MKAFCLFLLMYWMSTGVGLSQPSVAEHQPYAPTLLAKKKHFDTEKFGQAPIFNNSKNEIGKIIDERAVPLKFSPSFATANWGWVCRQELRMQKTLMLPVFFRLGSLSHTNALEGK